MPKFLNKVEQKVALNITTLFEQMEKLGPYRKEWRNYRYDPIQDFHHAHVGSSRPSYIVMWEADKMNMIINIVRIDSHENFNFHRKHSKATTITKITNFLNEDFALQKSVVKKNTTFHKP